MTENVFDKLRLPKKCFFFARGLFPIYLLVNLLLIWIQANYASVNTPGLLETFINFIIIFKILLTLLIVCGDPGKLKKDGKIEKYIANNRKDLANVKAPLSNGTFPLRSNF